MSTPNYISLQKAISLGEYNPDVLEKFSEFKILERYTQFQLIRKALKNRESQLRLHWAEIANSPRFSEKPHLKAALRDVEKQIEDLNADEEKLLIQYAK